MVEKKLITTINLGKFKKSLFLKRIFEISTELHGKIYLVGGTVRDLFTLRKSAENVDWDFAFSSDALKLGKTVARNLKGAYVELDKKSKTSRVVVKQKGKIHVLDFSTFRAPTLKGDLNRRDFTVNTLCISLEDLFNGKKGKTRIIDYFNAQDDIKCGLVRMVQKRVFKEDPLRILRGFSLCAQFGFTFDEKTLMQASIDARTLKKVAAERKREELKKILTSSCAHDQITEMDRRNILEVVLPQVCKLKDIDQGGFHHLDVWEHSLETLAQFEKLLKNISRKISKEFAAKTRDYLKQEISCGHNRLWIVKLACILHDIGKPSTRVVSQDGRVHFYSHEKIGAKMVCDIADELRLSSKESRILKTLVLYHLRAGQLVNRKPSNRAKFRFFRDTGDEALSILLLTLADRLAMQGVLSRKKTFIFLDKEIYQMIKSFFKDKEENKTKTPLLSGNQLMKLLKISQGPVVGKILETLQEARALKQINTQRQARSLAKDIYADLSVN